MIGVEPLPVSASPQGCPILHKEASAILHLDVDHAATVRMCVQLRKARTVAMSVVRQLMRYRGVDHELRGICVRQEAVDDDLAPPTAGADRPEAKPRSPTE